MASEKVLIIDHIDDIMSGTEVVGKHIFDSAGNDVKVKKGQGGALASRWEELQIGRAYSFTMGEFKGYPFVQDFKSVENRFVEQAQQQVGDKSIEEKRKSMAVSYAKDLAVAGIIPPDHILSYAMVFEGYMKGKVKVKDDDVFRKAMQHATLVGKPVEVDPDEVPF